VNSFNKYLDSLSKKDQSAFQTLEKELGNIGYDVTKIHDECVFIKPKREKGFSPSLTSKKVLPKAFLGDAVQAVDKNGNPLNVIFFGSRYLRLL
jgi:hypothetical protein